MVSASMIEVCGVAPSRWMSWLSLAITVWVIDRLPAEASIMTRSPGTLK